MSANRLLENGDKLLLEDAGKHVDDSPLHFAQVNGSSVVTRVIVVYASDLQSGIFGEQSTFIPADTAGSHGKYPGIGDTWNPVTELFSI